MLSHKYIHKLSHPQDPGTNRLYVCDTEGWPKHMHLRYEHFETELPFNRAPLYDHIDVLAQQLAATTTANSSSSNTGGGSTHNSGSHAVFAAAPSTSTGSTQAQGSAQQGSTQVQGSAQQGSAQAQGSTQAQASVPSSTHSNDAAAATAPSTTPPSSDAPSPPEAGSSIAASDQQSPTPSSNQPPSPGSSSSTQQQQQSSLSITEPAAADSTTAANTTEGSKDVGKEGTATPTHGEQPQQQAQVTTASQLPASLTAILSESRPPMPSLLRDVRIADLHPASW